MTLSVFNVVAIVVNGDGGGDDGNGHGSPVTAAVVLLLPLLCFLLGLLLFSNAFDSQEPCR